VSKGGVQLLRSRDAGRVSCMYGMPGFIRCSFKSMTSHASAMSCNRDRVMLSFELYISKTLH
jgi:hypothetical protein